MSTKYRTEIDGLRAIAILGVVLYHAGLKQMSGGYAGVDVFFVISGYLIGGNLLDDLKSERFSFRRFYTRRARRILPALVVMVLVVMCLGWFAMMPNDYRYMGGAAVTSLLSLSNIWFLNRIDYFNPEASQDPLIHTWSLGVEEQFYLIIPLLLLLLWRASPRFVLPVLLTLISASLVVALLTSGEYRMEAFYLLHTRGWELLAGVLVAWSERNRPLPTRWHTTAFLVGLALILADLWLVPPAAPWPGPWTLPAVFGTALVLAARQVTDGVKTLLANAPMRFVGLISYSLYLWHQPVISLAKKAQLWPSSFVGILAALAIMVALATLSWRFVEQPFRTPGPLPRFKPCLIWLASVTVLAIAIAGAATKGFPSRVSPEVLAVLQIKNDYSPTYRKCLISRGQVAAYNTETACRFGTGDTADVLLIGDSHGGRLAEPLGNALAQVGRTMDQLTLSSCLPVAGLINVGQSRASQCPAFNQMVLDHLEVHPEITEVVMFATWKNYMFDVSGPNMHGHSLEDGFYAIPLKGPAPRTSQARQQAFVTALAQQLRTIGADRHVTLAMPTPRPDANIPAFYATRLWWGTPLPVRDGYPRAIYDVLGIQMQQMFTDAIAQSGLPEDRVTLIDPADIFCDDTTCDLIRDGQLLFTDGNHPSLAGLDLIIPAIRNAVGPAN